MNKAEFILKLEKSLKDNHVSDPEDILAEYEEHFRFKLADGYSEEEIAAKLGNPETLAKQFQPETKASSKSVSNKIILGFGFTFVDLSVGILAIFLFSWVIAMMAILVASFASGVCLIGNFNIENLIPEMPYKSALILAIAMIALSALSAVGTLYCYLYTTQLLRAYCRFHKNVFSTAGGGPVYPPLAIHPQMSDKKRRILRNITLISMTVMAVGFVSFFVVCSFSAGTFGFWHAWKWFV